MDFQYADLETCSTSTGLVAVIDVLRAFTTAAFALAGGARRVIPVGSIDEALAFKRGNPGSLACGEMKGLPPSGFDVGNSPTRLLEMDLQGRTLVQRTSAGTQGVVRSLAAERLLAASFVVAQATVRYIQRLAPEQVTFVITGGSFDGGAEDLACAQYMEACLRGMDPDPAPYLERVRTAPDARPFLDPSRPQFPESDLAYATDLDRFDFAMPVRREGGLHVIERSAL